jgi:putative ABC transport system permease protein
MDFLRRHSLSALRQVWRQPALTLTVVLTLGLAIGANTAIFSFVNALLIRPFPFRDPDQLVEIHSVRGGQPGKMSMREVLDIKEQVPAIEAIAAHSGGGGGYNFSGDGRPEEWRAVLTTGNLFEVLGVPFVAGAKWPEIVDRDRHYRVILTYGVWQRNFGGRHDVVGKTITLDHAPGYEIHGVLPREFDFPRGIEVYRSIGGYTSYDKRDSRNVVGIARIKSGYGIGQLQTQLDGVTRRLGEQFPDTNRGLSFRAVSFRELYSGDVRPYLLVLLGAVGFVLLIACGNVANLLLARALSRGRETAVRVALGAGRSEIVAQFLAESLVLALLSAAAGLGLAWWWMRMLRVMIGSQLPEWIVVELDGRVLAFTLAVSILASVIAAVAPALQFSRPRDIGESLKEGGRGSSLGRGTGNLRDWMIAGEVALAVVLVAGAGLLIRAFIHLQSQDKGFREQRISTFRVALGWKRYIDQGSIARYYERALEKLAEVPGVEAVAFAPNPPLARQEETSPNTVQAEGQPIEDSMRNPYVNYQSISENYLQLLRIPLKGGRTFSIHDAQGGEPVAIVSDRLAQILWPTGDAIGRRLRYNPTASKPGPWLKVVGVASSVQHRQLGGDLSLDLYVPYRQAFVANQYILVRHRLSERDFIAKAEQALWSIDSEQSVFNFATYEQRILDGIWQLRLSRMLLVVFGVLALALAATGIYSVMSYLVGQRKREIGIRLALGATPASVQSLVVKRGLLLGGAGLAVGFAAALALGRLLERLVRGVNGADVVSLVGALVILLLMTLAASSVPALRASRIDPVTTLRDE